MSPPVKSVDRAMYLGDPSKGDPVPAFRDEVKVARRWPKDAVMRIVFTKRDFGHKAVALPMVEYYGDDGWPVDFVRLFPGLPGILSGVVKRVFQTSPCGWRQWDSWKLAIDAPHLLARINSRADPTQAVLERLSPFHPEEARRQA